MDAVRESKASCLQRDARRYEMSPIEGGTENYIIFILNSITYP